MPVPQVKESGVRSSGGETGVPILMTGHGPVLLGEWDVGRNRNERPGRDAGLFFSGFAGRGARRARGEGEGKRQEEA
jgi:hypothetical protein